MKAAEELTKHVEEEEEPLKAVEGEEKSSLELNPEAEILPAM